MAAGWKFKKQANSMSCWDKALNILSRRDHSVQELKTKLAQREYKIEEIEEVVQRLLEKRYLDDARCFDSRCRMLIARRLGKRRIQSDIARHGLVWNLNRFEELLGEINPDYVLKTMKDLLDKKTRSPSFQRKLKEAKGDRRVLYKLQALCMAHLVMKGFSIEESSNFTRSYMQTLSQ